jgi:hypothetical protein
MLLEVSVGEALDKYSILEIKHRLIQDERKRADVNAELEALASLRELVAKHELLYSLLVHTNQRIWDLTDTMKALDVTDSNYAGIAKQIFDKNQSRFRIKSMLNHSTESGLKEQKSYSNSEVVLTVTNPQIAVPVLWHLSLLYDVVYIAGEYTNILKEMFKTPNFNFTSQPGGIADTHVSVTNIVRRIPPPLRYVGGGRIGDFIHQLSVVFEMYLKTGRKGMVYLGEEEIGGDPFTAGLAATLADIHPIVSALPYIHSLEAYAGQPFDINLSAWRHVPDLYSKSWHEIFGEAYGVEWASHAWLTSVIRRDLTDVTLVCSSPTRWVAPIVWPEFVKTLPGKVVYLRVSQGDYDHFRTQSGIELPCLDVNTFTELVIAIHSCRKFVGTLSMPLAVADALKKDRLALTQAGTPDEAIAIKQNPNFFSG